MSDVSSLKNDPVSLKRSEITFHRVVIAFWFGSLVFHSAGFQLLPTSIVDLFSGFGFFNDVLLLREAPGMRNVAESYAGHMITSLLYMLVAIFLFLVASIREILIRSRIVTGRDRLSVKFFLFSGFAIVLGAYFMLSDAHSSFASSDRRFRGMPLWWVMLITTCMWSALPSVLFVAIRKPKLVLESMNV